MRYIIKCNDTEYLGYDGAMVIDTNEAKIFDNLNEAEYYLFNTDCKVIPVKVTIKIKTK